MNLIVFEIVKVQKKKKMSCKIFANLNGLLTLIKTKYHSKHSSRQPKKKKKQKTPLIAVSASYRGLSYHKTFSLNNTDKGNSITRYRSQSRSF